MCSLVCDFKSALVFINPLPVTFFGVVEEYILLISDQGATLVQRPGYGSSGYACAFA